MTQCKSVLYNGRDALASVMQVLAGRPNSIRQLQEVEWFYKFKQKLLTIIRITIIKYQYHPMGTPTAAGAKGIGCIVCCDAAEARDLGDQIPFCIN